MELYPLIEPFVNYTKDLASQSHQIASGLGRALHKGARRMLEGEAGDTNHQGADTDASDADISSNVAGSPETLNT